jgi:hypothetical protein
VEHQQHQHQKYLDPRLRRMEYDIGFGLHSVLVYVEPDVSTFYQANKNTSDSESDVEPRQRRYVTKVVPKCDVLMTRFINMSKEPVSLYW